MAKAQSSEPLADAPPPAVADQASLSIKQLARAVLDRSLRPRAASVRRLAEAVLADGGKAKKSKTKKSAASARKPGKKSGGKKRKLAKIPRSKE